MSENEKYKLNPSDEKKYRLNLEVLKKKVVGFHFVEEKNRYKVLFIEKGEIRYCKAYEIPGVDMLGHVKFDDDEGEVKPLNIKLKKKEKTPEEEEKKPLEESKPVEEPKEEKVEASIEEKVDEAPVITEEKKEEPVIEKKKLVEEFDSIPQVKGEEEKVPYGFEGVWQLENEDAIPFRDEELIIACDGLGGGGGLEVNFALSEEMRKTFIRNAFIGMDLREDKKLADFCLKIVDDVFDGEGPTKVLTHAAFASRIVVSRFVYAKRHSFPDYSESYKKEDPNERPKFVGFVEPTKMMPSLMDADLKDLSYRESVSAFISYGLMKMVKAFNMPEPPANSPLLAYTPSTLAAAIVRPNGDKLDVEVLWAGDSRIYSIDPELGFQQLSLDHEEAKGGRMTNKFTADKLALLDYAKYEKLPKNCVVFAASDGTFDPFSEFESLGVKGNLIGSMPELKDPFDFDAWEKNYFKGYTPYRGDDISIALNCYGYNGVSYFSALKMDDKSILDSLKVAWSRKNDLHNLITMKGGQEIDSRDYFKERTASLIKFADMRRTPYLERLVGIYFDKKELGEDDIALSPSVVSQIEAAMPSLEYSNEERCAHYLGLIENQFNRDPNLALETFIDSPLKSMLEDYIASLNPSELGKKQYSLDLDLINGENLDSAVEKLKAELAEDIKKAKERSNDAKEEFLFNLRRCASQGELIPYLSKSFLDKHALGKKEVSKEVLIRTTVEALSPKFPSLANEVCDLLEKNYTQTSKIEKGFYNEGQASKCRSAIIMENSIDEELTNVYDIVSKLEVDAYSRRSAVLGE